MRYKKKIVCLLIVLFLALNLFAITITAGGDTTIIYDGTNIDTTSGNDRIVINQYGDYFSIVLNDAVGKYYLYKSTDNGDTWTRIEEFWQNQNENIDYDIAIDGSGLIHFLYTEYGTKDVVSYQSYNTLTDTPSSRVEIETDVDNGQYYINSCLTVDSQYNVYVFWYNNDDNDLSMCKYNRILDQWGFIMQVYVETDDCIGLSADVDSIGDVYVSFIQQDAVNGNDLMLYRWDASQSDFDGIKICDLTINNEEDYTDIACYDNNINIVYCYNVTDGDLQVNYTIGTFSGSWDDEQIYYADTYDQLDPSISVSNDDVVHIVWTGNNNDLGGRDGVMGVRGNYNDWSSELYFAWDSADSIMFPSIYYQNYPNNLNAQTGIIGVADNITEHQLIFFDYGIMLNYSFDDEYSSCENDYFEIIKWSGDEIPVNVTAEFEIVKSGWSLGSYEIINLDTDTIVQTDGGLGFSEDRLTVYYKPLWIHGLGNYSINVGYYADSTHNLECDFEVVDGTVSLDSNWSIYTDKSTYTIDSSVDVFVVVPLGEIFTMELYRVGVGTSLYQSPENIGTGSIQTYLNEYYLGTGNVEYRLKLINETGIVKNQTVFNVLPSGYVPDEEGEWYGLPFWVPYLIGVFITLFITMSPLIIGTYISRNTRMTKVSIPPLLYVGFFFFGLVVSVLMGFLPSWLPFVILFGMITFFAVQWLYGKKGEIAGE